MNLRLIEREFDMHISPDWELLLGSASSRRAQLLELADIPFRKVTIGCEERVPEGMQASMVAVYLAELKALAYSDLDEQQILLTADTTVCFEDMVLNKPNDKQDAVRMLNLLSDREHQVITGVCLRSKAKQFCFQSQTNVVFKPLSGDEIEYYIERYQPFDKAGAYGIQEWIGVTGVQEIKGCYYNVMGLPVQQVLEQLGQFKP